MELYRIVSDNGTETPVTEENRNEFLTNPDVFILKHERRVKMKLIKDELRIIEIALSYDIKEQEKFLKLINGEEGLEEYLHESKILRDKIVKHISE